MAKTKPRKYESVSGGESISEHASEWIRLFIKHFELNLLDASRSLPTDASDLDHFEPQSLNPRRQLDYLNLVYACRRCNSVKRDQTVGNPFDLLHSDSIATRPDGSLHASDHKSLRLIRQLDLNSPRLKRWRSMWMRIVALAAERDADLYAQLVGFPYDLPDLGALKPPHNRRKEGLEECWFARRRRGELPNVY